MKMELNGDCGIKAAVSRSVWAAFAEEKLVEEMDSDSPFLVAVSRILKSSWVSSSLICESCFEVSFSQIKTTELLRSMLGVEDAFISCV